MSYEQGIFFNPIAYTPPSGWDQQRFVDTVSRTSAQGNAYGFSGSVGSIASADRNINSDNRAKGIFYCPQSTTAEFHIALDSASTKLVNVFMGDDGGDIGHYPHNCRCRVYDGSTGGTLLFDTDGTALGQQFVGAGNTVYSSFAAWDAAKVSGAVSCAFSTTTAVFVFGQSAGLDPDGNWVVGGVYITDPSGGGGDTLFAQACM